MHGPTLYIYGRDERVSDVDEYLFGTRPFQLFNWKSICDDDAFVKDRVALFLYVHLLYCTVWFTCLLGRNY